MEKVSGPVFLRRRFWQKTVLTPFLLLLVCGAVRGATGEIEIRTVDADTKQPVAVRMHLTNPRGRPQKVPRLPNWHDHFCFAGKTVLKLGAGHYTFLIERGPEHKPVSGHFIVERGAADTKTVEMHRFVDMAAEGWYSGDLHIHRHPRDIELLMLAEDLHVAPVITWWNDQNRWQDESPPEELLARFDGNRYYRVMAGEDEREGGALLYFNLDRPLPLAGADREYPSPVEFLKQARQHGGVHVDVEKPFWWDVPVWVASGMVDSIGLANNHLFRDGVLDNEAWGRPRDKVLFPSPHGNGRWSQTIYYHLLNCGLRIPPSAGSASGVLRNPVGYNRVYVYCGEQFDYQRWWEGLRAGRVVVTNGPLLRPEVSGQRPGHVFEAAAGETVELQPALKLSTRDKIDYLQIVKNGRVEHEVRLADWAAAGGRLPALHFDESGWMLIRAVTNTAHTYRFASSGPFFVQIGPQRRISRTSAQFFLDWVHERARRIQLDDPDQHREVIQYHRAARDYWQKMVARATVD